MSDEPADADRPRIAVACICCGSRALSKSPAILMPFVAHRVFGWVPVEIDDSWGLRTIRNGHAYSICNSVSCMECGMLFLDIRFTDAEMAALYKDYREEEYTALREVYEPGYRERNVHLDAGIGYLAEIENFLAPFVPRPARVLDWGGDTGLNTPFRGASESVHVYDISGKPAAPGLVAVDRAATRDVAYDLVVCSNVLEHVSHPIQMIADVRQSMRRDTVLYVEVPHEEVVRMNVNRARLCVLKKHWHEHVNFFGEGSLRGLLRRSGLDILAFRELNVESEGRSVHQLAVACKLAG